MFLLSSADFFKLTFSKYSFKNSIRVSNSLDPDQGRHSVGPDLDPNCLQRLSAVAKVVASKAKVKFVPFTECPSTGYVLSCDVTILVHLQ